MKGKRRLFHFTCDHGFDGIGRRGILEPRQHPLLPTLPPIVWLADIGVADKQALGLSNRSLPCDRTRYRYVVTDLTNAMPWLAFLEHYPDITYDEQVSVAMLGMHRDVSRWWVADRPVKARLG